MSETLSRIAVRPSPNVAFSVDWNECGPATADEILAGDFRFNCESHHLGERFDWRASPSHDVEWGVLLHKFYYAPCLVDRMRRTGDTRFLERWRALTQSWIDADLAPGHIAADVTGRRLQNWTLAYSGYRDSRHFGSLPQAFEAGFLLSIERQTSWLCANLHEARNHRTLELHAILLVSIAFPQFPSARDWRSFAAAALDENALSDFRADGGHCEQSSHYHCIVLRNFLNAVRLLKDNGGDIRLAMKERLRKAVAFAARLHRPDGEIAALSDADGGSYLDMIDEATGLLGDGDLTSGGNRALNKLFPDSGYAFFQSRARRDPSWLVFDCGPLGDGNHGHFDLHSVEIFGRGTPLIVDPGRYTYDESGEINWRAAFRTTAAHSTVEVDGKCQTRYERGAKKMKIKGPAAFTEVIAFDPSPNAGFIHSRAVSAEYDAVHHRRIFFADDDFFVIADDLIAENAHDYRLRFQLAPEIAGTMQATSDGRETRLEAKHLTMCVLSDLPQSMTMEDGRVSRRYGEMTPAPRLCVTTAGRRARFVSIIAPCDENEPPPLIEFHQEDESVRISLRRRGAVSGRRIVVPAISPCAACAAEPITFQKPKALLQ